MSEKQHKKMIGVYQIKNTVSGERFIGSSISFGNVLKKVFSQLLVGTHPCDELQKNWYNYSSSDFEFSILETCSHKKKLQDRYRYWLSKTNAFPITDPSALPYSSTGHVSVDSNTKEELRQFSGTFDEAVRALIDFYLAQDESR